MAIISKVAGSCTLGNNGWAYTDTATYIPVSGCVYPQPDGLKETDNLGYKVNWRVHNLDAGGSSFVRNHLLNIENKQVFDEISVSGDSVVDDWSTVSDTGEYNNGSYTMHVPNNKQYDFATWLGSIAVDYDGTKNQPAGEFPPRVMAMNIADDRDSSYSGIFETTGKHSPTPVANAWTPFDSNESCSAYICKKVHAENMNILNSNSSRSRTIVFSSYYVATPE